MEINQLCDVYVTLFADREQLTNKKFRLTKKKVCLSCKKKNESYEKLICPFGHMNLSLSFNLIYILIIYVIYGCKIRKFWIFYWLSVTSEKLHIWSITIACECLIIQCTVAVFEFLLSPEVCTFKIMCNKQKYQKNRRHERWSVTFKPKLPVSLANVLLSY